MRYAVMSRNMQYLSVPERPEKFFPFRFLANIYAKLCNVAATEKNYRVEFFVVDYKKWVAADGEV